MGNARGPSWGAGALAAGLLLGAGPAAAAGMDIGNPSFRWQFRQYLSTGVGGITAPPEFVAGSSQFGGALHETADVNLNSFDELEIFSNAGATTFWSQGRSPFGDPELNGVPLGVNSEFTLEQSFRKDEPDGSLSFTITQVRLEGSDPIGIRDNDGLWAYLALYIVADQGGAPFFSFANAERLGGAGGAWEYTHVIGPLAPEITSGGESESGIRIELPEPYVGEVDLSSVGEDEEFTLRYVISLDAVDTAQIDSYVAAYLRDPLEPTDGAFFEFTGLTPTDDPVPAPEPGRAAQLAAAALALGATAHRRRTRSPIRAPASPPA
ncbi:MAG TPA: hypothetical protein VLC53_20555 [Myxococcota bacterium]|nr:hypothetical protein [Myxococcota bacterium]